MDAYTFKTSTTASLCGLDGSAPSSGSKYGDVQTIESVIVAKLSAMGNNDGSDIFVA
ncbi:hypothetical protein F2Q70_00018995 [Brassica cretica]|uniref:Uncharacterized protein n=1 Tax=Brassica cretica TaxID=69181 RepID=A0A8S9I1R6_BRACR|nr:hypothetical protein F2Q70_00018995 [Brassica cretica]KAF2595788.1 hypothetical protein F2Q68_00012562 [Brassica cretica]